MRLVAHAYMIAFDAGVRRELFLDLRITDPAWVCTIV